MPVRIIFRGLILFRFPKEGEENAGKLVAQLINKPDIAGRTKQPTSDRPPRGPHEHNHGAQIQIMTGDGDGQERVPVELASKENLDIRVLAPDGTAASPAGVVVDPSFLAHVPQLSDVISRGTGAVRGMAAARGRRNDDLVRNIVTVDRGMVRVREVVTWDEGGFPLQGREARRGLRPASHALVKFVGSDAQGHIASEFVVDILDTNLVEVRSSQSRPFNRTYRASGVLNHRVPYDTVEILITNYEFQEDTATPWGLDFQWLFEAAGYPAVDLAGRNLDEFAALGARFNPDVYQHERRMLLDPVDDSGSLESHRHGRPFPYVASVSALTETRGQRLSATDEEDRPICIGGFE